MPVDYTYTQADLKWLVFVVIAVAIVVAEVAAQLTPVAQTWGIEVQRVVITP